MNIIAHKTNFYNASQFLNMVSKDPNVTGAMFDITFTKDNEIIVCYPYTDSEVFIKNIQSSTYSQIQTEEIITLDSLLAYFHTIGKVLYLNIIPILTCTLSADTVEEMMKKNQIYILKIKEILKKYPTVVSHLISKDQKVLYHVQENMESCQVGLVLSQQDLSYLDVDIYIFNSQMYNKLLIEEQLKRDKEVLLYVNDANDMSIVYDYYLEKKGTDHCMTKVKGLGIIANYPNLLGGLIVESSPK